jgi:hypothetical protein
MRPEAINRVRIYSNLGTQLSRKHIKGFMNTSLFVSMFHFCETIIFKTGHVMHGLSSAPLWKWGEKCLTECHFYQRHQN